jgi:hypothetical protein
MWPTLASPQSTNRPSGDFLGSESAWGGAALVLHQNSPLFGGREYYLWGDGRLVIVDFRRDLAQPDRVVERRFEMTGRQAEIGEVLRRFVDLDLLGVSLESTGQPGATCSNPPLLMVRNAAGQVSTLPTLRGAPTADYDAFLLQIAALMRFTRGATPVFQGTHDASFVPAGAEWAGASLRAAKQIPWAPAMSPEDGARQDQEWRDQLRRDREQGRGKIPPGER